MSQSEAPAEDTTMCKTRQELAYVMAEGLATPNLQSLTKERRGGGLRGRVGVHGNFGGREAPLPRKRRPHFDEKTP